MISGATPVLEALLTRIPENKLRPRLAPTARAAELLGDPQRSYRVIHVTGTNGKTSTTRFIERILRAHGIRTGRFTSPHLVHLNERIAIDGEPVSDETLQRVWDEVSPILDLVDRELEEAGDTKLTFFEALAVLGFAVFADAPVEVLVLEVGMGGEWDSTNVADGDVAVFTPISFDHMERLGSTLTEIAKTKSGIIKQGALVVSSLQQPEATEALRERGAELADGEFFEGEHFQVRERTDSPLGQFFTVSGLASEYRDLFLPLHGEHQAQNAATAIAAVEAFLGGGNRPIESELLRAALADASSPGRLQRIPGEPEFLLDAAHNPGGIAVLRTALEGEFSDRPNIGVISILNDKAADEMLERLAPVLTEVILTDSGSPRAFRAEELAGYLDGLGLGIDFTVEPRLDAALELASLRALELDGRVVVTGSITLVGEVLRRLEQTEQGDTE